VFCILSLHVASCISLACCFFFQWHHYLQRMTLYVVGERYTWGESETIKQYLDNGLQQMELTPPTKLHSLTLYEAITIRTLR
jgi:hypothetical protein